MTSPTEHDLHQHAGSVLVVDDNAVNRYILGGWLRREGFSVIEAEDGAQAVAILAAAPDAGLPELAVVDIRLPDMSGFEVCRRIKADERTASLPVIHVSATAIELADRTQGLNGGADAYLTEPIDPSELLATATAVLRYARARRHAEHLARRVATLNRTTLALYGADGGEAFTTAAAVGAAAMTGAPATAVALDPAGRCAHASEATPDGRSATSRVHEDVLAAVADHVLGDATGTRTTTVSRAEWLDLTGGGVDGSHLAGPPALVAARTKPGRPALVLALDRAALDSAEDRELLTQLAQTAALALEALRSSTEDHALALTLQRSFLPDQLPDVPGLDLAVRYEPAVAHAEIGGDFYEALDTPDGLLLAIGDVAGHSLKAALVMGELRHALRAYAIEGHDLPTLLGLLDTLLIRLRPTVTATLCLVLLQPDRERIMVANAGHLPPLLRPPHGGSRFLTDHGVLLGLGTDHPPATVHEFPAGSTLLLVTDGLIEVPGVSLDTSLGNLRSTFDASSREVTELCAHLVDTLATNRRDDVALLAAHLH
ncbi:SpoIIE family protein phosphatase [Kitasatospora sp. NPDC101801]|uniref:SpoIIE family protein phosphatase n=1 Tax=Kitasatospora sp. NPDC101801 TaxID=3364103 RepID=UPI00382716FF